MTPLLAPLWLSLAAPAALADEAGGSDASGDAEAAERGTVLTKDFLHRISPGGLGATGVDAGCLERSGPDLDQARACAASGAPFLAGDLAALGRVWTEGARDSLAPAGAADQGRLLAFTPGAHLDRSGQLWLSGSRVHTIVLDGVTVDVERPVTRRR